MIEMEAAERLLCSPLASMYILSASDMPARVIDTAAAHPLRPLSNVHYFGISFACVGLGKQDQNQGAVIPSRLEFRHEAELHRAGRSTCLAACLSYGAWPGRSVVAVWRSCSGRPWRIGREREILAQISFSQISFIYSHQRPFASLRSNRLHLGFQNLRESTSEADSSRISWQRVSKQQLSLLVVQHNSFPPFVRDVELRSIEIECLTVESIKLRWKTRCTVTVNSPSLTLDR